MKVVTTSVLVVLVMSMSACQPDAEQELETSAMRASEAARVEVDPGDCRSTLSASVRGVTGSFSSAAEAARSVKELPPEGLLARVQVGEDNAAFGWVNEGELLYVINTRRGDGGWTVGSYEKCLAAS